MEAEAIKYGPIFLLDGGGGTHGVDSKFSLKCFVVEYIG